MSGRATRRAPGVRARGRAVCAGAALFAQVLSQTDERLAALERLAERSPEAYLPLESAAAVRLERARLTGDWNDYAAAESLLAVAFERAPEGAGPFTFRAQLDLALHRVDRVEADLARAERAVLLDDPARAAIEGLRGDLALQRGRRGEAARRYGAALALHPTPQGHSRLALLHAARGETDAAFREFAEAERRDHSGNPVTAAWYCLQRGLLELDRGAPDAALVHYRAAEERLSGWWLVEEHIAEALALTGRAAEAEARYRELVPATGEPALMEALARLLEARGETAEARELAARAGALWEARARRFPEAARGHAHDRAHSTVP